VLVGAAVDVNGAAGGAVGYDGGGYDAPGGLYVGAGASKLACDVPTGPGGARGVSAGVTGVGLVRISRSSVEAVDASASGAGVGLDSGSVTSSSGKGLTAQERRRLRAGSRGVFTPNLGEI
jgi:hypothetical protein